MATRGSAGGRRVTSADVAAAAGVSRSAVSFAFNNRRQISESTRRKILDTAAELGYTPSTVARMLQAGQTRSLGVLLPQNLARVLENGYYAQFLKGVGQVCDDEGFTLLLTPPLRESMLTALPFAAVDGFLVCGLEIDRGEVAELRRRQIPFVLVDSESDEQVTSVDVDDRSGARDVVAHLLDLGHRRLALLSLDPGPDQAEHGYRGPLGRRMQGVMDALSARGMSLNDIVVREVPVTRSDGYRVTREVLAEHQPTALVAMSDTLAYGALDALHDLGLLVPEQVSVTGFDDQPESAWTRPALTTVRQAITAKGRIAAEVLVAQLRGEEQRPHEMLEVSLIVRESSGRAPT